MYELTYEQLKRLVKLLERAQQNESDPAVRLQIRNAVVELRKIMEVPAPGHVVPLIDEPTEPLPLTDLAGDDDEDYDRDAG